MNRNHISYRASTKRMRPQFLTSRNSLGIVHTESYWDKNKKQIVYLIKTNQMVSREIDVLLKDDLMTLEVPLVSSYEKPFGKHRLGTEHRNELDEGLTRIGFSEFSLKPGYQYSILSTQVINPNLIKVVLGFKPESIYRNN